MFLFVIGYVSSKEQYSFYIPNLDLIASVSSMNNFAQLHQKTEAVHSRQLLSLGQHSVSYITSLKTVNDASEIIVCS